MEIALPEPEFVEFSHLSVAMGLRYFSTVLPPSLFESRVWVDVRAVASLGLEALVVE